LHEIPGFRSDEQIGSLQLALLQRSSDMTLKEN